MCFTVDSERARSANSFAAIGVERDWFLAARHQIFIHDIEQFEERRVR